MRVEGSGFRVEGLGLRVEGLGFRACGGVLDSPVGLGLKGSEFWGLFWGDRVYRVARLRIRGSFVRVWGVR